MQATIYTPAVYSQTADPAAVPSAIHDRLPSGWRLSTHQLATYDALRDSRFDIVINSAMTGDGKSLAGLLDHLTDPQHRGVLALYPTNELIRDQEHSARSTLPLWRGDACDVTTLYGARLDALVAKADVLKRPGVLTREFEQHPLVLTNPDILHAILQFLYQQYGRDATNILTTVAQSVQQFTFDEFHIFGADQVTAVLIGLLLLYEQTGYPLKTLFLSATPDGLLTDMLRKAGFAPERIKTIDPQSEGWYAHGTAPGDDWRLILRDSTLTFVDQGAEDWVPAHMDDVIVPWFREHGKGAKAALIVNSVARALRLTALLQERLAPLGLTVRHNTGMTGSDDRQASYTADLLVGTSTVDVGVDFRINLLIFEASDAGTFMQRLGRLGRHATYTDRDGNPHNFAQFAAYALVPTFVVERLFAPRDGKSPLLIDGATVTRAVLGQHIGEAYPPFAEFTQYARHWGRFQAAKVYATLSTRNVRETFADVRQRLKQRYASLLGANVSRAMYAWEEYNQAGEERLVAEAQSFRGVSPFQCAVLQTNESDQEEVITYDLFPLLSNFQLIPLTKAGFLQAARQLGIDTHPYDRTPPRQIAYFRRLKLFETFQEVTVLLRPEIANWGTERYQSAQVLPGLEVDTGRHDWLNEFNEDVLHGHPVVALLVRGWHPLRLRSYLKLPGTFQLHQYRFGDEDQFDGSIAFGREALLLDSRLRYTKLPMPGDGAIIC